MYLINKIKKLLGAKEVPVIESIQTYDDVNLFIEGYKNYFERIWYYDDHYAWEFTFKNGDGRNITIIKSGSYRVLTGALINKKPFIRAFVWDNRYEINKEFLSRKKAKSDAEEEFLRLKKLDEEIEKKK